MNKQNARIEQIGYWFCGHEHSGSIRVQLELSEGGHCAFFIHPKKVEPFLVSLGRCEEDGAYIKELEGETICAFFDDNRKIIGVSDIMDENAEDMFEV